MRLAKYLARGGVASRRAAEDLVRSGRVTVGGEEVTDPARDVEESSAVAVDGRPVRPEGTEVWAVSKPAGVVSTAREPGRRRPVTDLVDSDLRLYPVGRLDVDSTGLILLTNDGELANRLTHPRFEVPKSYRVRLARPPAERELDALRGGVDLEDGPTAPAVVERAGELDIEITIGEGRKRQVRRMIEAVGNRVDALRRVRIGSLQIGDLRDGDARRLSESEVEALWEDSRPVKGNSK